MIKKIQPVSAYPLQEGHQWTCCICAEHNKSVPAVFVVEYKPQSKHYTGRLDGVCESHQNKLASLSDHDLAELGLQREQVERWDQIIARHEQEARETTAFLDAMRDSD